MSVLWQTEFLEKKIELWATAWQNQQNDLCAQQSLRSDWADAQSGPDIRPVWSESSLCAQRVAKDSSFFMLTRSRPRREIKRPKYLDDYVLQ